VSARHAAVFELPPDSFADNVALVERVRSAAARSGRAGRIRFCAPVHADEQWFGWGRALLSRYIAAGVTEFMVSGLADSAALSRFETEIMRPLAVFHATRGSFPRPLAVRPPHMLLS